MHFVCILVVFAGVGRACLCARFEGNSRNTAALVFFSLCCVRVRVCVRSDGVQDLTPFGVLIRLFVFDIVVDARVGSLLF